MHERCPVAGDETPLSMRFDLIEPVFQLLALESQLLFAGGVLDVCQITQMPILSEGRVLVAA